MRHLIHRSCRIALCFAAAVGCGALRPRASDDTPPARARPLPVPLGGDTPLLIDGRFAADEWRDALAVPFGDGDTLLVKQVHGHVFLGVHSGRTYPTYVDLFLRDGAGALYNLHASLQTGERALTGTAWTDRDPPTAWGNERDWSANVSKFRSDASRPRDRPTTPADFQPQDGREFQLRRARFAGARWRLRVELRDLGGGGHPDVVYPAGTTRYSEDGWAVLVLP